MFTIPTVILLIKIPTYYYVYDSMNFATATACTVVAIILVIRISTATCCLFRLAWFAWFY